mmetsp:Transcript_1842/g.2013  ORF Transcript_1842/g.2013 Transcript_1842/m.2013 type:complete len:89 (+) Transcript_1842:1-267(+)
MQRSFTHTKGCVDTDFITFLRGIFQGDSLSPLLFCLALAPIGNILKRDNIGYKITGKKVNNLLYIDDLKFRISPFLLERKATNMQCTV